MKRYDRIMFAKEVANPGLAFDRGNFNESYREPAYRIERDGDTVSITSVETGVTVEVPWAMCTGALPSKAEETAPVKPVQVVKGGKR